MFIGAALLFSTRSFDCAIDRTLSPFIETMRSPAFSPASSAGVFGETSPTTTGTIRDRGQLRYRRPAGQKLFVLPALLEGRPLTLHVPLSRQRIAGIDACLDLDLVPGRALDAVERNYPVTGLDARHSSRTIGLNALDHRSRRRGMPWINAIPNGIASARTIFMNGPPSITRNFCQRGRNS
jgi:hypothetical protein